MHRTKTPHAMKKMKNVLFKLFLLALSIGHCQLAIVKAQNMALQTDGGNGLNIGKLGISGDKITVEALVYRENAWRLDIVGKYTYNNDVNYCLRWTSFMLTIDGTRHELKNPLTKNDNNGVNGDDMKGHT